MAFIVHLYPETLDDAHVVAFEYEKMLLQSLAELHLKGYIFGCVHALNKLSLSLALTLSV
jgi:hypothetical protein